MEYGFMVLLLLFPESSFIINNIGWWEWFQMGLFFWNDFKITKAL